MNVRAKWSIKWKLSLQCTSFFFPFFRNTFHYFGAATWPNWIRLWIYTSKMKQQHRKKKLHLIALKFTLIFVWLNWKWDKRTNGNPMDSVKWKWIWMQHTKLSLVKWMWAIASELQIKCKSWPENRRPIRESVSSFVFLFFFSWNFILFITNWAKKTYNIHMEYFVRDKNGIGIHIVSVGSQTKQTK